MYSLDKIAKLNSSKTLSDSTTWASLYHSYVRIFLCQLRVSAAMLLIVKDWFKWVRGETWSHSGRFLVCKKLKFFIGIPNVNWLTE